MPAQERPSLFVALSTVAREPKQLSPEPKLDPFDMRRAMKGLRSFFLYELEQLMDERRMALA